MNRTAESDQRPIAAAPVALAFGATALADGPARKFPLSALLDVQGSQRIHIPPVPDHCGWVAPSPGVTTAWSYVGGNSGSCDCAGLANDWLMANGPPGLGTSIPGWARCSAWSQVHVK